MQTDESRPRVSVLIPAFNAETYVGEAIESIQHQTWSDFELILLDDASCDGTLAVMWKYARHDVRLRVVAYSRNLGQPAARNHLLSLARGGYVALLDADDISCPTRIARQVAFLDSNPRIDVLGSDWHRIDAKGRRESDPPAHRPLTSDEVASYLLFRCALHHPTVMARRDVLLRYGYNEAFPVAQDYDVWSRMAGRQKFAILPERLIAYRYHEAQATQAHAVQSMERRRACQARMLRALGMSFSSEDLFYHSLLYSGRRQFAAETGRSMDRAYVRWAGRWLDSIVSANDQIRLFEPAALRRIAGMIWTQVCYKATRNIGPAIAVELFRTRVTRDMFAARQLGRS